MLASLVFRVGWVFRLRDLPRRRAAALEVFSLESHAVACQDIVKDLFGDLGFKKEYGLGAVNSINWVLVGFCT